MTKPDQTKKIKKSLSVLLKLFITAGLLYLVYSKIKLSDIKEKLDNANMFWLLMGIVLVAVSQVLSSARLRKLMIKSHLPISLRSNSELYVLGMFYNFFIPGGVGGDAYKVYLLNKSFGWKVKRLIKLMVADRLFGMFGIIAIVCLLGITLPYFSFSYGLQVALGIAFVALFLIMGRWFVKLFFKDYVHYFYIGIGYSVVVQLFQVLCVICILQAFGGVSVSLYLIYILVFLISSLLSVFSFSGIGVREYVFLQASAIFSLDIQTAVSVGAVFSILTAVISAPGLYYHFRKPALFLEESAEIITE